MNKTWAFRKFALCTGISALLKSGTLRYPWIEEYGNDNARVFTLDNFYTAYFIITVELQ